MAANGLLLTIAEYVGRGRAVKEIIVDNKARPTGVTIVLDDGGTISWKSGGATHDEFMQMWKQATVYLRESLIKEQPAG